jgi:hypothetical protein
MSLKSIQQIDSNHLPFSDFEKWTGINEYQIPNDILIVYVSNLRDVSESALLKRSALTLKNGENKKVILFCVDMDWADKQQDVDIIANNLNDIFGENIDKVVLTLCSRSWNKDWKNIKTIQNFGCLSMVIDRNIQYCKDFDLLNTERKKHFITTNNEPRPIRIYLYDFLIKNNLLDKFEYSFFAAQNKDYITWEDKIGGNDGLDKIEGIFPKKLFDNETINDKNYDVQVVNIKHELNSYFSILMETNYMNGGTYYGFSEKSFKGFATKKPFMLWASPAAPKGLEEMGFKLYDKIFDTNNWSDSSHDLRRERFFDDIKRISDLPINQIKNMYIDNLETIEHNYNNLVRLIEKEKEDFINLITK